MSEGKPRVPELEADGMREYTSSPASASSGTSSSSGCGCVPVLAAPAQATTTTATSTPATSAAATAAAAAAAASSSQQPAANDPTINISIIPTTGGQFDITVDKNESIENLKKIISKRLKVAKERICLLHRERQLREGTLEENRLQDGSRLTLLPSVETGLLAQRPEQSVMQALESLSDSQVNDFLSGKAPLNLTMRLGDHMMLIQLQLSTVTPATGSSPIPSSPIQASSTSGSTNGPSQPSAEIPLDNPPARRSSATTTTAASPAAAAAAAAAAASASASTSASKLSLASSLVGSLASASTSSSIFGSPSSSPPSTPTSPTSASWSPTQLSPPTQPPQSPQSPQSSPATHTTPTTQQPPVTPPGSRQSALGLQNRHPARHRHLHPARHPYHHHHHHHHQRYIRKISQVVKPSCPSCAEAEAAALAAAAATTTSTATTAAAASTEPKCSEFSSALGQCDCTKSPKKKPCVNCSSHASPHESKSEEPCASPTSTTSSTPSTPTSPTTPTLPVSPTVPTSPGNPDATSADPVANATTTLDTRALVEASRNLTQKLKQLSSEENAKRRQGAIIESMHHHGKGVYTGTFSGTLNPALQDRHGRPKRDISTIIHILNDLLCATPATTAGHYRYQRHPSAHRTSVSSATSSSVSSTSLASQSSSMFAVSSSLPATTTTISATGALQPTAVCPDSTNPVYSSEELSKENEATKGKMKRLRLVMEQRREKMRARRQARAAPYTTKWAAVTPDPDPNASSSTSTSSSTGSGKSSSDQQNEPELQPCSPEPVVA